MWEREARKRRQTVMGFKESLQDDRNNVFFNTEEFADEHVIDKETVMAIVQEINFSNLRKAVQSTRSGCNSKERALNKNGLLVLIQEEDVKKLKRKKFTVNSMITLDGSRYFVSDVSTSGGITKLTVHTTVIQGGKIG